MGRPSKFTQAVASKLIEQAREGLHKQVCAWGAGIHPDTLENWLEAGERNARSPYSAFARAFRAAEAEAERVLTVRLKRLGTGEEDGFHQATVEFLKRRWPKRWGDRAVLEQSGLDGGPIRHEISPAEVRDVLRSRFGSVGPSIDKEDDDAAAGDLPDSG